MNGPLFWLIVLTYGLATLLMARNLYKQIARPSVIVWWLALAGWIGHAFALGRAVYMQTGGVAVDLSGSLDAVALVLGFLFLTGWRISRLEGRSVGILLLPVVVVALLGARFLKSADPATSSLLSDPLLIPHLLFSLFAYGLFSVAVVLALLDAYQEHALKKKQFGRIFNMLPSLGVVEESLFVMIRMGFLLLSLSIFSGIVYTKARLGVWFMLSHKVVFSWATWLTFATLLLGNRFYGWRGGRAVRITLGGYLLLALGFLGVKVVTELILKR
ncbi:MAG: cytochrome c biogenesis protein CcsA [Magnetococcales bacterium]|nr:cytochrome c biogenesis protein CcsA [Magnetococcales bacterium]